MEQEDLPCNDVVSPSKESLHQANVLCDRYKHDLTGAGFRTTLAFLLDSEKEKIDAVVASISRVSNRLERHEDTALVAHLRKQLEAHDSLVIRLSECLGYEHNHNREEIISSWLAKIEKIKKALSIEALDGG